MEMQETTLVKLRYLCQGMSVADLAKLLGVTHGAIYQWLKGTKISPRTCAKIDSLFEKRGKTENRAFLSWGGGHPKVEFSTSFLAMISQEIEGKTGKRLPLYNLKKQLAEGVKLKIS